MGNAARPFLTTRDQVHRLNQEGYKAPALDHEGICSSLDGKSYIGVRFRKNHNGSSVIASAHMAANVNAGPVRKCSSNEIEGIFEGRSPVGCFPAGADSINLIPPDLQYKRHHLSRKGFINNDHGSLHLDTTTQVPEPG